MNKHTVAVYGSLRKGFGNHHILSDGDATYVGLTEVPGFDMYSLGAFPFLNPNPDAKHPIVVEVYMVNDYTFMRLDGLEGYPTFYNRMEVHTIHGKAWIYYINDTTTYTYHEKALDHGDWSLEGVKYGSNTRV